jgi:hypothetical protein
VVFCKTGDIILFPSSLTHMVETKEGTNTRISLAFNVFIKGTVGNNKNLTELLPQAPLVFTIFISIIEGYAIKKDTIKSWI